MSQPRSKASRDSLGNPRGDGAGSFARRRCVDSCLVRRLPLRRQLSVVRSYEPAVGELSMTHCLTAPS
jgi:hypothetical protein